jgi:hypothetical protein
VVVANCRREDAGETDLDDDDDHAAAGHTTLHSHAGALGVIS